MTWAYIAGFFDGEGSLSRNGNGFRITIPQTNIEVLNTIQRFAGCGNVIHVTKRQRHWKESWIYAVAKQEDVLYVLRSIGPHLVVKRHLMQAALPDIARTVAQYRREATQRKQQFRTAMSLRKRGWTYRDIGKRLGMDWGWTRRKLLRAQAKP
ncbi:LAGLIDADG family homing endonuclease [Candidatus Uhrbacteria bacterium]|nr:LAGLIDADG family homing endonuclease [Candidatus Uhrbacteria bacterium]